jgi:hypothetical protein
LEQRFEKTAPGTGMSRRSRDLAVGQTGALGKNTRLSDFGLQEVDSVPAEWLEGSPIPGGFFPVIGDGDMLPAQRRKMRHDIFWNRNTLFL